jgi:hypothetical protein
MSKHRGWTIGLTAVALSALGMLVGVLRARGQGGRPAISWSPMKTLGQSAASALSRAEPPATPPADTRRAGRRLASRTRILKGREARRQFQSILQRRIR